MRTIFKAKNLRHSAQGNGDFGAVENGFQGLLRGEIGAFLCVLTGVISGRDRNAGNDEGYGRGQ